MNSSANQITLLDDGLFTDETGEWSDEKHRILAAYAKLFNTGMKNKWKVRTYIDLFAGPGLSKDKETGALKYGSPLIALSLKDTFTHYIFCDADRGKLSALQDRVRRCNPTGDVAYVEGDVNEHTDKIVNLVPRNGLSLCFVDPYDLKSLRFRTIERLALPHMDFIILLATYMDAQRNVHAYCSAGNTVIDELLGDPHWRAAWEKVGYQKKFSFFLLEQFARKMEQLGYLRQAVHHSRRIELPGKKVPLYRLAFFSRHPTGRKFWKEALKYTDDQLELELPEVGGLE